MPSVVDDVELLTLELVQLDRIARAMWVAAQPNPTLPQPLPFDQLTENQRAILYSMARAARKELLNRYLLNEGDHA
jgi:hypothetical protein